MVGFLHGEQHAGKGSTGGGGKTGAGTAGHTVTGPGFAVIAHQFGGAQTQGGTQLHRRAFIAQGHTQQKGGEG